MATIYSYVKVETLSFQFHGFESVCNQCQISNPLFPVSLRSTEQLNRNAF